MVAPHDNQEVPFATTPNVFFRNRTLDVFRESARRRHEHGSHTQSNTIFHLPPFSFPIRDGHRPVRETIIVDSDAMRKGIALKCVGPGADAAKANPMARLDATTRASPGGLWTCSGARRRRARRRLGRPRASTASTRGGRAPSRRTPSPPRRRRKANSRASGRTACP